MAEAADPRKIPAGILLLWLQLLWKHFLLIRFILKTKSEHAKWVHAHKIINVQHCLRYHLPRLNWSGHGRNITPRQAGLVTARFVSGQILLFFRKSLFRTVQWRLRVWKTFASHIQMTIHVLWLSYGVYDRISLYQESSLLWVGS